MLANIDDYEYLIDLDYIFKWVCPKEEETCFNFWVASVTMIFENAHDVKINIESPQGYIEIECFHMKNPTLTPNGFTVHTYRFDCQEGEILLKATGYKMYVRQKPKLLQGQCFDLKERNGVSLIAYKALNSDCQKLRRFALYLLATG